MSEPQWLDKWECDRCSVIWHARKEDAHVDYEKMVNGRMRLLCPKCFNQVARQSLRDMVDENKALRDENARLVTEIKRRIWLLHGLRLMHNLYGDDGNMDCNSCFRRYAEATLEQCYEWEIADAAMIVTKAALDGGKGVQG